MFPTAPVAAPYDNVRRTPSCCPNVCRSVIETHRLVRGRGFYEAGPGRRHRCAINLDEDVSLEVGRGRIVRDLDETESLAATRCEPGDPQCSRQQRQSEHRFRDEEEIPGFDEDATQIGGCNFAISQRDRARILSVDCQIAELEDSELAQVEVAARGA